MNILWRCRGRVILDTSTTTILVYLSLFPACLQDFGDYSESFYSVQTTEGETISQLIAGYIDIILKKVSRIVLDIGHPDTSSCCHLLRGRGLNIGIFSGTSTMYAICWCPQTPGFHTCVSAQCALRRTIAVHGCTESSSMY